MDSTFNITDSGISKSPILLKPPENAEGQADVSHGIEVSGLM